MNHAGSFLLLKAVCHVCAAERDSAPHQGMNRAGRRIHEGRQEQPGTRGSHLVLVHMNLGDPIPVEYVHQGPGLRQVPHEPVPVVVMARIGMIQPGHTPPFVLGPLVLAIPLGNHLDPVGIQCGHKQHDGLLQGVLSTVRRFSGHQAMGQFHTHLRSPDFRGMQAACDQHNGPSPRRQSAGVFLRQIPLIPETARDLPVLSRFRYILRRGDYGHDQWTPLSRFSDGEQFHAVGFRIQTLEVLADLSVIRQFPIRANGVSEKIFG